MNCSSNMGGLSPNFSSADGGTIEQEEPTNGEEQAMFTDKNYYFIVDRGNFSTNFSKASVCRKISSKTELDFTFSCSALEYSTSVLQFAIKKCSVVKFIHIVSVMAKFTAAEYADMVTISGVARGNGAKAARLYAEHYPQRVVPETRTFRNALQRLREGNILPRYGGEGRPKHAAGVRVEEAILEAVEEDLQKSIRAIAASLGIGPGRVQRLLQEEGFRH
ncbi:uncharacterized protein LOC135169538 [Diachasmimorpha longicaudata]|uniref:uncharacterized protein LOC135169538 n=1 Tax=Diachasmimorpha longicaudata TaxID=58733 RepID=UPI0030B8A11B